MQIEFNKKYKITPKIITKLVKTEKITDIKSTKHIPKKDIPNLIIELEHQMHMAANALDFEGAINLSDKISWLKERLK